MCYTKRFAGNITNAIFAKILKKFKPLRPQNTILTIVDFTGHFKMGEL